MLVYPWAVHGSGQMQKSAVVRGVTLERVVTPLQVWSDIRSWVLDPRARRKCVRGVPHPRNVNSSAYTLSPPSLSHISMQRAPHKAPRRRAAVGGRCGLSRTTLPGSPHPGEAGEKRELWLPAGRRSLRALVSRRRRRRQCHV
jgi:hypothetical protein